MSQDEQQILSRLMSVIEDRKQNPPEKSYTTTLLAGGTAKIAEKILEEAQEVVEAAEETDTSARSHLIHEAADLIFHLMVMLGYKSISWEEIEVELGQRFGISGLDEKAARTSPEAPKS
ncbi:MAG: phosphoribosyl-ATP diphosphatase [Pirellulaceae bacterium]|nr:phosphoribosyl-ATP diphosphatase [Pirellulaceae bacterium]